MPVAMPALPGNKLGSRSLFSWCRSGGLPLEVRRMSRADSDLGEVRYDERFCT